MYLESSIAKWRLLVAGEQSPLAFKGHRVVETDAVKVVKKTSRFVNGKRHRRRFRQACKMRNEKVAELHASALLRVSRLDGLVEGSGGRARQESKSREFGITNRLTPRQRL
jgi:hypothetical protein